MAAYGRSFEVYYINLFPYTAGPVQTTDLMEPIPKLAGCFFISSYFLLSKIGTGLVVTKSSVTSLVVNKL